MKEPWTSYIPCCCCCRPKPKQPKADEERAETYPGLDEGRAERPTKLDGELAELPNTHSPIGSPAERAIDLGLRHSSSSRRIGHEEQPNEELNPPPPSYDVVLRDNVIRSPESRRPAELATTADDKPVPTPTPIAPASRPQENVFSDDNEINLTPATTVPQTTHIGLPQESVFSDDDDVVLTPPTTAPPTVIDEDSEDEGYQERLRER